LYRLERDTDCRSEPITPETPTGIAGCEVFGEGIASHYGPGDGVAMNFCTFALRTTQGCGFVEITSIQTGRTVVAPVVDFGDLYTGTPDQRIVDLQYGVVAALGLDLSRGLYEVVVWPAQGVPRQTLGSDSGGSLTIPDTAGSGLAHGSGTDTGGSDCLSRLSALIATSTNGWLGRFLTGWLSTICVELGAV
jgi:hypothetical protein